MPPVGATIALPLGKPHVAFIILFIEAVGPATGLTTTDVVAVQCESDIVTVYVPATRFDIVGVVSALFHKYVYGPPVPKAPIPVAEPLALLQYSGNDVALAVTSGCVPTTNDFELEHPLLSLTVTVYVPPATAAIFCVTAAFDHEYEIGATPPVTVIFIEPLFNPVHVSSFVVPVIFGPGLFATTPVEVAVHPRASVTVTEYVVAPPVIPVAVCVV